mgnify:CR=1 FL=1
MIIKDGDILLAMVISKKDTLEGEKNFFTDNAAEFQVASFNLAKDNNIERHYHPSQPREILKTSEVILVQSGLIILKIYNKNFEEIESVRLSPGDVAILIDGGHELIMEENSQFIEVKQGPYDEQKDKKRF